jgi:diguanylate cyclase (GGDEF)-like protein
MSKGTKKSKKSTGSALTDAAIARLMIFQGVNPTLIRPWVDQCFIDFFRQGDFLLTPEADNDTMYVILEGQLSVHLQRPDEEPIALLDEGESVGEMSVLDHGRPSAYVRASKDTTVLLITRESLLEMIDHSHGLARNILYVFSTRLRQGNEAVNNSYRLQKEYEKHANIDVLTGLYNRRWINEFFQRSLSRANKTGEYPEMSVMLIDADHFKDFNDKHGHFAGDHALKCIADALRESIRPTDLAARYGGEEFMVILPETSWEQAEEVAQRVRKAVAEKAIEFNGAEYPPVSISSGITQVLDGDEFGDIISAADHALYEAKASGRNRVCITQR